ncbi:BamA/TamA family outer membrane protein [Pelomyxa schiedti]|nr:BamA/TamA family outer membrane protein [Pelomyxa schiedti]
MYYCCLRFMRHPLNNRRYLTLPLLILFVWFGFLAGFWGMMPLSSGVALVIIFAITIWMLIPVAFDTLLCFTNVRRTILIYVFPITCTVFMDVYILANPYGTIDMPGAEIATQLMVLQLLSLFGIPGLIFFTTWISSFMVSVPFLWTSKEKEKNPKIQNRKVHLSLIALFTVGLYFFSGVAMISDPVNSAYNPPANVRLGAVLIDDFENHPADWVNQSFAVSKNAADAGAKIVMWSEWGVLVNTYPGDPLDTTNCTTGYCDLLARSQELAISSNIWFAPCFILEVYETESTNSTWLSSTNRIHIFSPNGTMVLDYTKTYPVWGAEDFITPGDGHISYVDTPYGRIAAVVCADAGYPTLIQQAGRDKVDIMLVPSEDWQSIYRLTTRLMMFRAVENGMVQVRATIRGRSQAVDPRGNLLLDYNFFEYPGSFTCDGTDTCRPIHFILTDIPTNAHRFTLYPWLFDIPTYLCYVVFLFCLIFIAPWEKWKCVISANIHALVKATILETPPAGLLMDNTSD